MCGIPSAETKVIIQNKAFDNSTLNEVKEKVKSSLKLKNDELHYFIFTGKLVNNAYNIMSDRIKILFKDGTVKDIAEAADTLNIQALSEPVEKYFLCFPKMN